MWGHLVESEDGFSVQVIHRASFPEVTIRYKDGLRTMDVFSAEQFKITIWYLLDRRWRIGIRPIPEREWMTPPARLCSTASSLR